MVRRTLCIASLAVFTVLAGFSVGCGTARAHEGGAHAQEASETSTERATTDTEATEELTGALAPDVELSHEDFDLPAPTSWEFLKRRFVHFFTLGEVNRTRQELEIAQLTLLAARQAELSGDTDRAELLLGRYETQIAAVESRVERLVGEQLNQEENTPVAELLTRIQTGRVLDAALLEQLSRTERAAVAHAALEARTKALRSVARFLAADAPDAAKFQQRLAAIGERLTKRQAALEVQVRQRLALFDELDEALDELGLAADVLGELERGFDELEQAELRVIAAQDAATIGAIVREIEGNLVKHTLVLEAVLAEVPEVARPAVQAAIDRGIEKLQDRLASDASLLEKLFDEERRGEAYEKLLARLEKEAEKANEDVQKAVRRASQAAERAAEKQRERRQQDDDDEADEDEEADDDEDADDETPQRTTPTPSTSPPTSSSPSPGSSGSSGSGSSGSTSSEPRTESESVAIEDFRFKDTALEVAKGTKLTIRLKNKDSVPHNFTLVGTSTGTGTVSADGEGSVTFTVDGELEFYCSLHPSIPHGKITLKD